LQHQDGHSHVMANTIPNCRTYDPTYGFELAVIIQNGMHRMFTEKENCFYYITTMNENYVHPEMPVNAEEGIIKGMYQLEATKKKKPKLQVQLMGAGSILREVRAAAIVLREDYGVESDVWSLTSINELTRDGQRAQRWNMMHPESEPRVPYITQQLTGAKGPVIAATDYLKTYAEQLRAFIPNSFSVLGTEGFGRSDTRANLRRFFEVDCNYVVIAALKALSDEGQLEAKVVASAMKQLGVDPEKLDPMSC